MIRSDRYIWLKYGSYALLLLGFFVLQSSRGTALWLGGATVNVLPFLVAAVALLDGGMVCMAVESFFAYIFHDLLIYGMSLPQAMGLFGRQLLLSLPVGALAYVLVSAVHRRFTEESL